MTSEGLFDVPLKIRTELSKAEYKEVCIDFQEKKDSERVRITFPIYEGQENLEILLKLLREFSRVVERTTLLANTSEAQVYNYFQTCLAGDALDTWFNIMQTEDKDSWVKNLGEFVEISIGKKAYEPHFDYLKEAKKPQNMTVKKWLARIKSINNYLPFLKEGKRGETLSKRVLVKIISRNVPRV